MVVKVCNLEACSCLLLPQKQRFALNAQGWYVILKQSEALAAMQKYIDIDQIPSEYGGSSRYALGPSVWG